MDTARCSSGNVVKMSTLSTPRKNRKYQKLRFSLTPVAHSPHTFSLRAQSLEEPLNHNENRRKFNHVFLGCACAMGNAGDLAFRVLRFCGGVESVDLFPICSALQPLSEALPPQRDV
jgi:hypothetical protein